MAWRFDKCVTHGEIDHTVQGRVTGKLWLLGREQPMILDLVGDAWPDLAGCQLTFVNPHPVPQPQYDEGLSMHQTGSVGDIRASMKLKKLLVPEEEWMKALEEKRFHEVPWVLSNSLYLEWFSDRNGRAVIQTTDYKLEVSDRCWEADDNDQAAQQAINDENMRAYMEDLGRMFNEEPPEAEAEDEDQDDAAG